jgi:cellulose biosynthesis protein BcsQ
LLSTLNERYDAIVINSPPIAYQQDAINLMQLSNQSLFIVRADYTKEQYVNNIQLVKDRYNIKNVQMIINDLHPAFNYDGSLIGSRFEYITKENIADRIKRLYKRYIKETFK